MHYIPSGAPSKVGSANSEGTGAAFARTDHIHEREHTKYTDVAAKAAAVQSGAITNGVTLAPTHDAVYDVKVTADGALPKSTYNAQSIVAAILDNTPVVLSVAEQRLVGRITGQDVGTLTAAQVRTLLGVADGADVTGSNAPQAHAASHKWLGSDETNIRGLLFQKPIFYVHDWANLDGMVDASDGGSVTPSLGSALFQTSATQGKTAHMYGGSGLWINRSSPVQRLRMGLFFSINSANVADVDIWFGYFLTPAAPSTTQKHAAFHVANGSASILWSSGDGSTEETGDTGNDLALFAGFELVIMQMENNDYYYVNGILKGTASTNLADNGPMYPGFYFSNTGVAANELINLNGLMMMSALD
jgi:hypothetical protein